MRPCVEAYVLRSASHTSIHRSCNIRSWIPGLTWAAVTTREGAMSAPVQAGGIGEQGGAAVLPACYNARP